jgi:cytochrome oxidase Cu insertion factor (SCO1/SenC/PrrC family)
MRLNGLLSLSLLLSLQQLAGTPCLAVAAPAPDLDGIAYEQRLGNRLPWHMFFDDTGRTVQLTDLIKGKPLVLVLGYFRCPDLCNVVRGDLLQQWGSLARISALTSKTTPIAHGSVSHDISISHIISPLP